MESRWGCAGVRCPLRQAARGAVGSRVASGGIGRRFGFRGLHHCSIHADRLRFVGSDIQAARRFLQFSNKQFATRLFSTAGSWKIRWRGVKAVRVSGPLKSQAISGNAKMVRDTSTEPPTSISWSNATIHCVRSRLSRKASERALLSAAATTP